MRTLLNFGSSGSSSLLLSSPNLGRPRSPPIASGALDRRRSHSPCLPLLLLLPLTPSIASHPSRVAAPDPSPSGRHLPRPERPHHPHRRASTFFTPDLRCKCLALSNLFWSLVHIVPIGVGFDSGLGYVMWGLGFIVSESCEEISVGFG